MRSSSEKDARSEWGLNFRILQHFITHIFIIKMWSHYLKHVHFKENVTHYNDKNVSILTRYQVLNILIVY